MEKYKVSYYCLRDHKRKTETYDDHKDAWWRFVILAYSNVARDVTIIQEVCDEEI
jgi:hypothetical protein